MTMDSHGGIILTGETEEMGRKTCLSVALDPGANPVLHCDRPATNSLSHILNDLGAKEPILYGGQVSKKRGEK
jgi:hypothetical protein